MQALIFPPEFRTFYDLGLRKLLAPLFLALFSPFSAELVTNIHPLPISGCQKQCSWVHIASTCCLCDCAGYSFILIFEFGACEFKVEKLNSYLHYSKFFSPVVQFSSSTLFFTDNSVLCLLRVTMHMSFFVWRMFHFILFLLLSNNSKQ